MAIATQRRTEEHQTVQTLSSRVDEIEVEGQEHKRLLYRLINDVAELTVKVDRLISLCEQIASRQETYETR